MKNLENAEKQTVLNQPHRAGDTDQRLATEFGRFCVKHIPVALSNDVFRAGEEYGDAKYAWLAANGLPCTERRPREAGNGDGASPVAIAGWKRKIDMAEAAMVNNSIPGATAAVALICEHRPVHVLTIPGCIMALVALARELRCI